MKTWTFCPLACWLGVAIAGCGDEPERATAWFATDATSYRTPETFFDAPFPAAWRMTATGAPDITGYPMGGSDAVENVARNVALLRGVPVMPNVYFRLGAAPTAAAFVEPGVISSPMTTIEAPVVFINVDPESADLGQIVPSIAAVLPPDKYAPAHVLAVAPAPGMVLLPDTTYAVAITRAIGGIAAAKEFTSPPAAIAAALAPMWEALATHGMPRAEVVVATVFTTGDVVADLAAQVAAVREAYDATIEDLAVDPVDGAAHDDVCELVGHVAMPQFLHGTPPYATQGEISFDANGVAEAQGSQLVPFTLTLPKQEMPEAGWPLHVFMHGSGSRSTLVIDGGPSATVDDPPAVGKGPGYVVALHGMAAVGAAMPLNPERLPGASDYAYLNIANLSAMPYVFAQGVFEQGLLLDAILALQIDPVAVASCAGVALPIGATEHVFNASHVTAGGQSMGGMYANMVGAVDPRVIALVPTGAGGLWHKMALESAEIPGGRDLLANIVRTNPEALSMLHPAMGMLALGWHRAEPFAYMARLGYDPLPGMPARHIYEPVGENDTFFTTSIYDAAALAYRNQLGGEAVWSTMLPHLALAGLGDAAAFPVSGNRTSRKGEVYTGVVAQFAPDGILDAHYIWRQLPEVAAQYGPFLAAAGSGVPTVPAAPSAQ